MAKVKCICKTCGKEFWANPSEVARGRKYCSKECSGASKIRKVKRICERCGKEFFINPSRGKDGRGKYCSKTCAGKAATLNFGEKSLHWKGGKEKLTCEECGKEFFRWPGTVKCKHTYCSRSCANKSSLKILSREKHPMWKGGKLKCICKACGKEFLKQPSDIKSGRGKYCSRECSDKAHIGESSPRWKERVESTCKQCGKQLSLLPWQIKRGGGNYCSVECRNESHKFRITCICKQCGSEFETTPARRKSGKGVFCSKKCHTESKNKKIKRVCKICGKEFETLPSNIKNGGGKYCSVECNSIAKNKKIKCICPACGEEFFATPSKIKSGKGKYCSKKCSDKGSSGESAPNWKGGISFAPYCYKFNKTRKKATREYFGFRCIVCGKEESENIRRGKTSAKQVSLSVHHIDHDKDQGCSGKPFNLVPLCINCHAGEGHNEEEYRKYINKTLEDGFKWGIWNREEYIEKVMY